MIKYKYKIFLLVLPVLLLTAACNKVDDFGDTNINPGAASVPTVTGLFSTITSALGSSSYTVGQGYYCQYFSETQYPASSLYSLPQANFSGNYAGAMYDCVTVENLETSTTNQKLAARIAKNYFFWVTTDSWGDVPYSQSLQGTENVTPVLDKQEDIYKGMIADLTQISGSIDASLIFGDLTTYNGDPASWRRLANSLRILMALRLSKKYPAASDYSATEIKAALADPGGVIENNSQNLAITYPGGTYKFPYYSLYDGRKDVAESKTMTDLMGSLNDTRQDAFGGVDPSSAIPTASSNVGVPYGFDRATVTGFTDANTNWAFVLRGDLRTPTSTLQTVTASEVLLARAEAADRGWTTEDATAMYQAGITASFDQWGETVPANYFTQSGVALGATGTGANLKQIAIQRYIATYPDGMQGWSEWRRTGYPELTPAPDATNSSGEIVRRYVYGTLEYNSNGTNVQAAAARIPGGDTQDSRVWWDQ